MKIVPMVCCLALLGGLFAPAATDAAGEGKDVLVVYASRYGSTAQTAQWIAEGMAGKADVVSANEAGDLSGYKALVLGSGIYNNALHADMGAFLENHGDEVKAKLVALFVVCGMPPDQAGGYLEMFAGRCGVTPALARAFPGWQKKELLSDEDYQGLERYYKSVNYPFENYDHTDRAKCQEFGKEILAKACGTK